jgi:hypothetical protein
MRHRLPLLIAVVLAAACSESAPSPAPAQSTCLPGQSVACVGVGGCSGGQLCQADGKSFGACECSVDLVDSSVPDTTPVDSSVPDVPDTTPVDSSDPDTTTPSDTSCTPASSAAAIKPPVDIIVAIDQSGSMSEEVPRVRNGINKLSEFLLLSGLTDFRVVAIAGYNGSSVDADGASFPTSTSLALCVPPPLGAATCGAETARFRQSNINVQGFNALKIIATSYDSTTAGLMWRDFIRAGSAKSIVVITDDDSNSMCTGTYCGITAADFDARLLGKPGAPFGIAGNRRYVAYPIIGASTYPLETACGTAAANAGPEYIKLAKTTGGKWYPICDSDFGPSFSDIGKSIVTRAACEVLVPPPPSGTFDDAKVNVTFKPSTSATPESLKRDDSAACSAGANGWQYGADKKSILLCGDACTRARGDLSGQVNVHFGCPTVSK